MEKYTGRTEALKQQEMQVYLCHTGAKNFDSCQCKSYVNFPAGDIQ